MRTTSTSIVATVNKQDRNNGILVVLKEKKLLSMGIAIDRFTLFPKYY